MPSNGGGNQKSPEVRQRTAERELRILQLRLCGAPFEAIGRQIGISTQAAFKGYYRALHRIPEPDAKKARKEQLTRLNILRLKIYDRLADSRVKNKEATVNTALRIEEREAKMLGDRRAREG